MTESQRRGLLETFSAVVESIYDCALEPNKWHQTMAAIAELTGSKCCLFGVMNLIHQKHELMFHVGVEDLYLRLYAKKYGAMNPHFVPLQLVPVGTVVTTPMLVQEQEFLESKFYLEFLKPQGLRDGIGFNVLKTQDRIGGFGGTRLESQGDYGATDIRLLSLLAPHVCRSVAISDVLNLKTVNSAALEATLDALAAGVYLTDGEARIVYMNHAAETQVISGSALRIVNKRLSPVDQAACAILASTINEATTDEASLFSGRVTLALPGDDNIGLVATILPLNRGERRNLYGTLSATVAIFVQDPIVVPPLPGEAFARLYGLTGSELRVLLAMAPGLSVKEAAEILGIGHTTTKTHLQNIYAKTGTSKQTELMHLFMSSAPPVHPVLS